MNNNNINSMSNQRHYVDSHLPAEPRAIMAGVARNVAPFLDPAAIAGLTHALKYQLRAGLKDQPEIEIRKALNWLVYSLAVEYGATDTQARNLASSIEQIMLNAASQFEYWIEQQTSNDQ